MPDIDTAFTFCVNACNNPNVGYSQDYRNQRTVNGKTYYDCSSLMWYSLDAGNFDVKGAYQTAVGSPYSGNAITTASEEAWLRALGFTQVNIQGEWKPGDILWRKGHTEMVYSGGTGSGVTMGAHSSRYAFANQVSINSSASSASSWTHLWRYGSGGATQRNDWIKGNRYLTQSEMENNACLVYDITNSYGWTLEATCGMLGNMEVESTINPGIWQNLTPNVRLGWGLVQWTPSTNITDWLHANGYENDNGDAQMKWICEETVNEGQWIETTQYPVSFNDFIHSTDTPEELAYVFLYNFERPNNLNQPDRKTNARKWYEFLQNYTPGTPLPTIPPDNPSGITKNTMPVWMMVRYFY